MSTSKKILAELEELRKEVSQLRKNQELDPKVPIPGKRCTVHVNCSGGSQYCNDGGPITDFGTW
jgi:hypothetical protein